MFSTTNQARLDNFNSTNTKPLRWGETLVRGGDQTSPEVVTMLPGSGLT